MNIIGHSDYIIYSDGRVYSKRNQLFLKPELIYSGYNRITLSNPRKRYSLHRLVAQHYIENPENKSQVNHIDGNKNNNCVDNLEWVTPRENANAYRSKLSNNKIGHKNISYRNDPKRKAQFRYYKKYFDTIYERNFKTLTDALCYKFIVILKIKVIHHRYRTLQ